MTETGSEYFTAPRRVGVLIWSQRRTSCNKVWLVLATLAAIGVATGARASALSEHPLVWLFAGSGVSRLASAPGGRALLAGPLNHRDTWVFGKSRFTPKNATRLAGAPSLSIFRHAIRQPVSGVLLDLEHWPMTPARQQIHPIATYVRAAAIARAHGVLMIATPAFDLVRATRPHYRGRIYPEFLRLALAGRIAPYVDVYEIQAQGAENNPAAYRSLVRAVARQVHASNPAAMILAGLSTGPSGQRTTSEILYRDVQLTRTIVSGYWLNIPGHGAACPRCTGPRPAVAIKLLKVLAYPQTLP